MRAVAWTGAVWLGVRDVLDGCGGLRACVSVVALLRVSALVCTVCLSSRMSCPGLRFGGNGQMQG